MGVILSMIFLTFSPNEEGELDHIMTVQIW